MKRLSSHNFATTALITCALCMMGASVEVSQAFCRLPGCDGDSRRTQSRSFGVEPSDTDPGLPTPDTVPVSMSHASEIFWIGYFNGWKPENLERFANLIIEQGHADSDNLLKARGLYFRSLLRSPKNEVEASVLFGQAAELLAADAASGVDLTDRAEVELVESYVMSILGQMSDSIAPDTEQMLNTMDSVHYRVDDTTQSISYILLSQMDAFSREYYSAIEHALTGLRFARAARNIDLINHSKYACLFALSHCQFDIYGSETARKFARELLDNQRLPDTKKKRVRRLLNARQGQSDGIARVAVSPNSLNAKQWRAKTHEERSEYLDSLLTFASTGGIANAIKHLPLLTHTIKLARGHCGTVVDEIEIVRIKTLYRKGDFALAEEDGKLLFAKLKKQKEYFLASKLAKVLCENSALHNSVISNHIYLDMLCELHTNAATEMIESIFRAGSHHDEQMVQRRRLDERAKKLARNRDELLRQTHEYELAMTATHATQRYLAILCLFLCVVILVVIQMRKNRQKIVDRLREYEIGARCAAEQASKEKEMLLARVCHDLRTPLSVVRLCSSIVATPQDVENGCDKEVVRQKKIIQLLNDSAMQMSYMTDQLLSYSKSENSIVPRPEELKPAELLGKIRDSFSLRLAGSETNVLLNVIRGAPERLYVDGRLVREVLNNLLDNAIKHTPLGSVVIQYQAGPVGNPQIVIKDNGCGMKPDVLRNVFAPFFSGNATQPPVEGGVGLGLFICEKLTRRLGGSISVSSELGIGTTVTLNLPVSSIRCPQQVQRKQATANRVLLVAQSLKSELKASKALCRLSWESSVTNNRHAISAIKNSPPAIVVVDLSVEEKDCLGIVKAIFESCDKKIPIVAISESKELLEESRACSFVNGAISKAAFYDRMEYHLTKHLDAKTDSSVSSERS